ncbi:hypothetical protein AXFE_02920 [Acidithrix ferrooxidans]|uniref:Uncharacterized protein n=1 Tax=Acidithrix ferrooxidans TaxID=1280514 RepID=A0A0D8HNT6_9ACTN|nr:hypothetical protein AXFE_02920 [Acidithrix ferrooxidans]
MENLISKVFSRIESGGDFSALILPSIGTYGPSCGERFVILVLHLRDGLPKDLYAEISCYAC